MTTTSPQWCGWNGCRNKSSNRSPDGHRCHLPRHWGPLPDPDAWPKAVRHTAHIRAVLRQQGYPQGDVYCLTDRPGPCRPTPRTVVAWSDGPSRAERAAALTAAGVDLTDVHLNRTITHRGYLKVGLVLLAAGALDCDEPTAVARLRAAAEDPAESLIYDGFALVEAWRRRDHLAYGQRREGASTVRRFPVDVPAAVVRYLRVTRELSAEALEVYVRLRRDGYTEGNAAAAARAITAPAA